MENKTEIDIFRIMNAIINMKAKYKTIILLKLLESSNSKTIRVESASTRTEESTINTRIRTISRKTEMAPRPC
jgi:hypothetical protein